MGLRNVRRHTALRAASKGEDLPQRDRSLSQDRVDELIALLGLSDRPSTDVAGLHSIYSAWCRSIPFDNLQKLLALHANADVLPGMQAVDFFKSWQSDGTGGTCWSTNNALHALLCELGFSASMWSASMFDGPANHGTTIVAIDDVRWVVDTAIHGDRPARLIDGETTTVLHAGYPTTVRHDANGPIIEHPTPDPSFVIPCRILHTITYPDTVVANERSRGWSPFNSGLMTAINDSTGVWMLKDNALTRIDESGNTTRTLTTDETDDFLINVFGYSNRIIAAVRSTL